MNGAREGFLTRPANPSIRIEPKYGLTSLAFGLAKQRPDLLFFAIFFFRG
jgi:hypothetical protein